MCNQVKKGCVVFMAFSRMIWNIAKETFKIQVKMKVRNTHDVAHTFRVKVTMSVRNNT